jgi:hypothetical protein
LWIEETRMGHWAPIICWLATVGAAPVDTQFIQVAPAPPKGAEATISRSFAQDRAVVLIQGLNLHLLNHQLAARPEMRFWQQSGSVLVKTLAHDADVYAFSYAQTAPINDIAELPDLGANVARLRQAGYTEIVLVGFSAGGLIARHFVEDHPMAGVARVVQVCTPNAGSPMAKLPVAVGAAQKPFLHSLTTQSRGQVLEQRRDRRIPEHVDFVCVIGNGLLFSDGMVSTHSQWPDDLQAQSVPAVSIITEHWLALRGERAAQLIARLVRERQPRWDAAQIAAMRKRLWEKASSPESQSH